MKSKLKIRADKNRRVNVKQVAKKEDDEKENTNGRKDKVTN